MHTDITTHYLGMKLRSPLIVGACPLTRKPELVRELTIAGAGAVVLPSLLEEQIVREMMDAGQLPSVEEKELEAAGSPQLEDIYNGGVSAYLRTLAILKRCTGIPIIASLNGCAHGDWYRFASRLEGAGADAIELAIQTNLGDASVTAQEIEDSLLRAVEVVCESVSVPVAVKLLPFFTSLPNLAVRLADVGVAGIVVFGREPIWDVFNGALTPTSRWSLSDCGQLQTTLSGLMQIRSGAANVSIAASGGISTAKDLTQSIIAGADVAMVTSEVYRTGPDVVAHILEGVTQFLQRHDFASFEAFVARCRSRPTGMVARQSRVHAMVDTSHYRDPHPEPVLQTGDRWGHLYQAPHVDEAS